MTVNKSVSARRLLLCADLEEEVKSFMPNCTHYQAQQPSIRAKALDFLLIFLYYSPMFATMQVTLMLKSF